jgi:hypothetical protein
MWNGKPVAGNKGSCPYGSTWVEPQAQTPTDDRSFGQKGIDLIKNNPLEAASMAALAIPFAGVPISGAIRGAGLLYKGGKMASRTGKLMDKLLRKPGGSVFKPPVSGGGVLTGGQKFTPKMFNQSTKSGLPVQPRFSAYKAPYNKTSGRVMRRPSAIGAGMTGLAGAGAAGLYASGSDERATNLQALQAQQKEQAGTALDANTQALMAANATEAETKRVAGLNPLEAMMENMKKPGYWTSPLVEGGPASDNRLNRLGQLMNYYGSTPKQRASMGDPQKGFIKTEETAADNLAAFAKAQQTLSSKYGKPTVSNLATGMYDMVEEAYGDTWMPFDEKGEDELKRISTMAANIFVELSQDPQFAGASEDALRQEAVIRAGEELQL